MSSFTPSPAPSLNRWMEPPPYHCFFSPCILVLPELTRQQSSQPAASAHLLMNIRKIMYIVLTLDYLSCFTVIVAPKALLTGRKTPSYLLTYLPKALTMTTFETRIAAGRATLWQSLVLDKKKKSNSLSLMDKTLPRNQSSGKPPPPPFYPWSKSFLYVSMKNSLSHSDRLLDRSKWT